MRTIRNSFLRCEWIHTYIYLIDMKYGDKMARVLERHAENASHPPMRVQSDTLLGKAKQLRIVHNGREYRLRMTQNGKLILTA